MEFGYVLKITNKNMYKEIQLPCNTQHFRVGTFPESDLRLYKDDFFEQFDMDFICVKNQWKVTCSDNIYFDVGDVRKLLSCNLKHGDVITVRYQESALDVFKMEFLFDFDNTDQLYDCKFDLSMVNEFQIGDTQDCNIILRSPYVKNDRFRFVKSGNSWKLTEESSLYGIYVNGIKLENKSCELRNYDFFSIANYHFFYKNGSLYTTVDQTMTVKGMDYTRQWQDGVLEYPLFNRNTRVKTVLPTDGIEVLDPPAKPEKPEQNLVMTLLPAIVMLVLTVVLRGFMSGSMGTFVIFSACTMSIGIFTSIASYIQGKKQYKQKIESRDTSYRQYIEQKKTNIESYREEERELLNHIYPDLDKGLELVKTFSGDLFEKTPGDEDFLRVRLGTGSIQAARKINYKNKEKFVSDDELTYMPEQIAVEYSSLKKAPIVLDLRNSNAVGIIGNDSHRYALAQNMILDLAIHHYHEEVKFAFVLNEEMQDQYRWIRLLPHVTCEGAVVRRIACDEDSRTILFENLYKELSLRSANSKKEQYAHLIIFVLDEMRIKTHPLSKFISTAASINVTFVFFEQNKEKLPLWCDYIIYADEQKGTLINSQDENIRQEFEYPVLRRETAESAAVRLAPVHCEKVNLEGSLVKNITLFEVLQIYNVEDLDLNKRWQESCIQKSMAAPLGVKTKNELVYLDLHEKAHGPHGLVAGTTGSGKSEILQSYILSMATLFHPYEVGFVIIDFKGGGMANQFERLPHMLGSITNIDGNEINRSLSSIKAELLKRQNYFAEAGVNHIDKYIQKYKNKEVKIPLPHLIIIVDEFAELKAEYPDFMKELISAARIGRSLGVHLILATQKPSGQVNEQIWSNSRFKLCLKVQTPEDSNEMIKSPLAAEIVEPGRAYFQVGNNEIFELFQSGFSGAPEKASSDSYASRTYSIYSVSMAGKKECVYRKKKVAEEKSSRTQLEAIVDYVAEYCMDNSISKLADICMPPLAKVINYPKYVETDNSFETIVEIGLIDDPDRQRQDRAVLNLSTENTMVIGASQYGKTNLLQTIIRGLASQYSPKEVNIYILDFASMVLKNFESLHHVGGVVCSSDDERFKNLFKLLYTEIERRKELLVQAGVSSFVSYREMGKTDLPQIVLLVDNFTAVKELYLQEEDILLTVCREGLAVGISVVICNQQTAGLGFRYLSAFAKRIALYCNESSEYSNIIDRCKTAPSNVPGRAVTEVQKNIYEMQTYLSFEGEKEIDRVKHMRVFVEQQNSRYSTEFAVKIPEIPAVLEEKTFTEQYHIDRRNSYVVPVALDYEEISVVSLDLLQIGTFSIIGREGGGKTNMLKVIFGQLYRNMFTNPVDIYLIDGMKKGLREFKDSGLVKEYSIDAEDFITYVEQIYDIASERYDCVAKEDLDLTDEPLQMIIVQNDLAIQSLCRNAAALKKYKELTGRLKDMKVCVVYVDIENAPVPYSAPDILKELKEKKNFFYFDDLQNLKICDISTATLRKFKKKITLGDGYWLQGNEINKIKAVKAERQG